MRVGAYSTGTGIRPATSEAIMSDLAGMLTALEEIRKKAEDDIRKIYQQAESLKGRRDAEGDTGANINSPIESPSTCVTECKGDLFSSGDNLHLVHCVSGDFRMSSGIAVCFKDKFGGVDVLLRQQVQVGGVGELEREGRRIFYLLTKKYSSDKPTFEAIKNSLSSLLRRCTELGITALGMPRIGCGLDGFEWPKIKQLIEEIFNSSGIKITVLSLEKPPKNMTIPRAPNTTSPRSNNWHRKQYYKSRQHRTDSSMDNRGRAERSAGGRSSRERSRLTNDDNERRDRSRSRNYRNDRRGDRKKSREHSREKSRESRNRGVGRTQQKSYRDDKKADKHYRVSQGNKGKGGGSKSGSRGRSGGGKSGGGDKRAGQGTSGGDGGVHYHVHFNK